MSYYYFAASLPMLSLGESPALPYDEFVALCRSHLSSDDVQAVLALEEDTPAAAAHAFAREWRDKQCQIRNASARARATRRGRDASSFLKAHGGFDAGLERAVTEAFARENPLQTEEAIDRARWDAAEDLAGHDPFSLRALMAYAVKLRIAERWDAMTEENGWECVDQVLDQQASWAPADN